MNTGLAKELGLEQGMRTYFAHAPAEYFELLGLKTYTHRPDEDGTYDFMHAFYTNKDELETSLPIMASKLSYDGVLWVSVPKTSQELDKESVLKLTKQNNLKLAKETSFADWSALQFVVA